MKALVIQILNYLVLKFGLTKPMKEDHHLVDYVDCFYTPWYGDEIDHFWEEF